MENRTTADKFSPESRARGARYAWMMTIGMMLVAGLEVGVMLSCFGNFYGPIMKATGMQASDIGLYFTAECIVSIPFFMSSKLIYKLPFKAQIAVSGVATVLACVIMANATGVFAVILAGAMMGIACAFGGIMNGIAGVVRWFVKKRGFAMSLISAGCGALGAVFSPVIAALLVRFDYQTTFYILAAAIGIGITAIVVFLTKEAPEKYNLPAYGEEPAAATAATGAAPTEIPGMTLKDAMGTGRFWALLLLPVMLCGFVANGMSSLISTTVQSKGSTLMQASYILSIKSIATIGVAILAGILFDKKGCRFVVALFGAATVVSLIVLGGFSSYIAMILFGALFACISPISNNLSANAFGAMFGRRDLPAMNAWNGVISSIGAGLGPAILPMIVSNTGSYDTTMFINAAIVAVGAVCGILLCSKKNMPYGK